MKTLILCLVASLGFSDCALRADPALFDRGEALAVVAAYDSDKAAAGSRAHAILHENHISSIAAGSAGYALSVPSKDEARARQLLAKAVLSEGLDITLFRLEQGRYTQVTPQSILSPPSKQ